MKLKTTLKKMVSRCFLHPIHYPKRIVNAKSCKFCDEFNAFGTKEASGQSGYKRDFICVFSPSR
jgi:hypothetical protein